MQGTQLRIANDQWLDQNTTDTILVVMQPVKHNWLATLRRFSSYATSHGIITAVCTPRSAPRWAGKFCPGNCRLPRAMAIRDRKVIAQASLQTGIQNQGILNSLLNQILQEE